MKKILFSLAAIAAVGILVVGATGAFFSDTETAENNTYTAGTIDISVDGENPWTNSWSNYLDKPSQTNYMNFTIKNDGENPARVWKRLANVENGAGDGSYCGASSEPEYEAGGGVFGTGVCENGVGDGSGYVERDNLSAFMVYDMAICIKSGDNSCLFVDDGYGNQVKPDMASGWEILIDENDQVRVDNVAGTWIELTKEIKELAVGQVMAVSQSYHLTTWDDSGQPMVTNWAQGDTMKFDVELEARQIDAPAPGTNVANGVVTANAQLAQKNTTSWVVVDSGPSATLSYEVEGATFDFTLTGSNVIPGDYQLVYYPDPWANPKAIVRIGSQFTVGGSGVIDRSESDDLGMDLPEATDANYPAGAKVWLVPAESLSGDNLSWSNLDKFLFDVNYVNYDDTGI